MHTIAAQTSRIRRSSWQVCENCFAWFLFLFMISWLVANNAISKPPHTRSNVLNGLNAFVIRCSRVTLLYAGDAGNNVTALSLRGYGMREHCQEEHQVRSAPPTVVKGPKHVLWEKGRNKMMNSFRLNDSKTCTLPEPSLCWLHKLWVRLLANYNSIDSQYQEQQREKKS